MAGQDRMTIAEVVRQVLREEHADVIRESVRAVAQELMEAEVSDLIGGGAASAPRTVRTPSQRLSPQAVGHQGRGDRAADPQDPSGQLLPELPAAPLVLRAGAARHRPAGLCLRRQHAAGRSAGRVAWAADLKELGVADRRAARRAGSGVPGTPAGGPLPVCVRRREDREGPRRRPRAAQGCGLSKAMQELVAARSSARKRRGRDRGVLDRVPAVLGRAGPGRRPAGHQRRAPGSEGRAGQGPRSALAALHRALPTSASCPQDQHTPSRPDPVDLHRATTEARSRWPMPRPAPAAPTNPRSQPSDALSFCAPLVLSQAQLAIHSLLPRSGTDHSASLPTTPACPAGLVWPSACAWLVGRAYISQKSMAPLFAPRPNTITTNNIQEVASSSRLSRQLFTTKAPRFYTTPTAVGERAAGSVEARPVRTP